MEHRSAWRAVWAGGWALIMALAFGGALGSPLAQVASRWAVAWLGLGVVLALAWPWAVRLAEAIVRLPAWLYGALVAGGGATACAWVADRVFGQTARVQDEVNYAFMGKMLAAGRLWIDAPPAIDFLTYRFFVTDGRVYSLFQPGWPALLALGELAGAPWLVAPLVSGVALALMYGAGRRLLGEREGRAAVALMACGQAWWLQGGSMMSHTAACALGLGAVYAATRYAEHLGLLPTPDLATTPDVQTPDTTPDAATTREDDAPTVEDTPTPDAPPTTGDGRARAWLAVSGACLGLMFTMRAATAVALALPIIAAGVWLVVRGRSSWHALLWFGAGLAPTGSIQLVYNAIMSGHPLRFPQDHYFALTEEVARCHRLGLGPGVGCPYEHGPDLAPGGFTLRRALQVTGIRLAEVRGDLFGARIAPIAAAFALASRRQWRVKLLLAALCLSVVGMYLFYYYHGNLYGARYYFEALPYLMWLVVLGGREAAASVRGLEIGGGWPRRVALGLIAASALVLPAYHVRVAGPKQWKLYSGGWGMSKALHRAAATTTLTDAVVLVPGGGRAYWPGFVENAADLSGPVIYARDWGNAMNAQLADLYPKRRLYRAVWQRGEVTFTPITLPAGAPITIEGEAKFPPPRRADGYAVPQPLRGWPLARASRGEHLLFEHARPGAWLEFRHFIPTTGPYTLAASLTQGPDYGTLTLSLDGQPWGDPFDGFDPAVRSARWRADTPRTLTRGWHTVRLTITGKNDASRGWVAGLDTLAFTASP